MKKYPIYEVQNFHCHSDNGELYVNTFQNHLLNHSFVEEPHRHNSYLLVFFTQGSGTHEVDFDVFDIGPGSLFVLQPGQMHYWDLSKNIEGFVVIYAPEIYNLYFGQKEISGYPFYDSANNKPEIQLNAEETKAIVPYFNLMVAENLKNKTFSRDKILNLLDCIHIEIARKYSSSDSHQTHAYNVKIKNFEVLLEQHFKTKKRPSFYAAELNITLKHLNRITNEILKKTATEVISERVILEAKRMLTNKQLSVNEIADALGYEDYSYFSRLFKKQTQQSPTHFRNER